MKNYDPVAPLYAKKKTRPLWFRVTLSLLIVPFLMAMQWFVYPDTYLRTSNFLGFGLLAIIQFALGDHTVRKAAKQQIRSPLSRKQVLWIFTGLSLLTLALLSFSAGTKYVFSIAWGAIMIVIGIGFPLIIACLIWSIAWLYKVYFSSKRLPYPEYIDDHG